MKLIYFLSYTLKITKTKILKTQVAYSVLEFT